MSNARMNIAVNSLQHYSSGFDHYRACVALYPSNRRMSDNAVHDYLELAYMRGIIIASNSEIRSGRIYYARSG